MQKLQTLPTLGNLSKEQINFMTKEICIENQIPESENQVRFHLAAINSKMKRTGCTSSHPSLDKHWLKLEKLGVTPDYIFGFIGKAVKSVGKRIGKIAKGVGKVAGKVGSTLGKVALGAAGLEPTMFDKKKPEPVYTETAAPVTAPAPIVQQPGGNVPDANAGYSAPPVSSGGGGGGYDPGPQQQEQEQASNQSQYIQQAPANNTKMFLIIGGAALALILIIVLLKRK